MTPCFPQGIYSRRKYLWVYSWRTREQLQQASSVQISLSWVLSSYLPKPNDMDNNWCMFWIYGLSLLAQFTTSSVCYMTECLFPASVLRSITLEKKLISAAYSLGFMFFILIFPSTKAPELLLNVKLLPVHFLLYWITVSSGLLGNHTLPSFLLNIV